MTTAPTTATTTPAADLFPLGRTVVTRGAMCAIEDLHGILGCLTIADLLRRHQTGDDGDLDDSDKAANARAIRDGERVLSAYNLMPLPMPFHDGETRDGTEPADEPGEGGPLRVWVITEWDRSYTTVLLPEEY
jgi:hypothetical protein